MTIPKVKSGISYDNQRPNLNFKKMISDNKCLFLDGTPKCKEPKDRFYNYDLNMRKAGEVTREQLLQSAKKAAYYCNYIVTKEPHSFGRWLDLLSVGSYDDLKTIKALEADIKKNSSKWDASTIAKKFNELNGSVDSCGYAALGLTNVIPSMNIDWKYTPGQ
jgi:hypothetical protein